MRTPVWYWVPSGWGSATTESPWSAARAMGFTPLWLDLLSIPGITSDVINWWNTRYSRFSRLSQRSRFFNQRVWEAVTTGNDTLPDLSWALNSYAAGWPWRFLKANARDYRMSELFRALAQCASL